MEHQITIAVILYFVGTFLFATLWIRFSKNKRTGLSKLLRRHYYLFPLVPLYLIIFATYRLLIRPITKFGRGLRWAFEKLSGKKTLKKSPSDYDYGRRY